MAVAGAVADINREVAEGDSQTTLQALQSPLAGLRGVLSECADNYQTQLAQRQDFNTTTGNLAYSQLIYGCLFSCQHTPSLTNQYTTFPTSSASFTFQSFSSLALMQSDLVSAFVLR